MNSTIVYKCPGAHQRPGGTFDYMAVSGADELNDVLKAGWSKTLPEAISGTTKNYEAGTNEPAVDSDKPPTRAEIEAKCKELGILAKKNMSNTKLLAMIDEKLK